MPPKESFYQILGVNSTALPEEIRKAYKALAKENHPDRIMDPEKKKEAEKYVAILSEAYNALADAERRKQYDEELRRLSTQKEPDHIREAKMYFKNGNAKYNEKDYESAIRYFRGAIHLDKNQAVYHVHLGIALSKNPKTLGEAIHCMEEAIRLESMNASHYKTAGLLFKQAGMTTRAKKMFENALKWNPEDEVCRNELNQLDGKKTEKKGFFSFLFKKS